MPATRRTAVHVERIESLAGDLIAHERQLSWLVTVVEEVTEDGMVDPCEDRLLDRVLAEIRRQFAPIPETAGVCTAEACAIDSATGLLSTLANTMSVTDWLDRRAREAAQDERRLIDDGLIEPIAA